MPSDIPLAPGPCLKEAGLQPGSVFADLNAGSGFYTMAADTILAGSGKIYSIEKEKWMSDNLALKSSGPNIVFIHGDPEKLHGTKIPNAEIDVAVVHSLADRVKKPENFFKELVRITKPRATVLLIDFYEDPDDQEEYRRCEHEAEGLFAANGFEKIKTIDDGDLDYALIFRKK